MRVLWIMVDIIFDQKFLLGLTLGVSYSIYKLFRKDASSSKEIQDLSEDDSNDAICIKPSDDLKLVLVIRTDLKMGKGKIAAQCSHAAVAAYKAARKHPKILRAWENCGQAKITLKVDNEAALLELSKHAKAIGLLSNVVRDAGRTQIASGSKTVCAIGPGPDKLIDQVTGHLKLF